MTVQIRQAGPADAVRLARLHALGFDAPWTAEEIATLLSTPGVLGLEAAAPDCVGFLLARVSADEAEILTLVVAPYARRRGLARALLEHAMLAARALGARALFLEVAEPNGAARALYAASGFIEVARRPSYYRAPSGRSDAVVMRRGLE